MTTRKLLNLVLIAFFATTSCSKDPHFFKENTLDEDNNPTYIEKMVLGKQLTNPYSVENMQKAYEALSPSTKAGIQDGLISTTHRYIKFIPKNEDELSLLKLDSTLILFQYPLDHEIISYGSYRDPNIPKGQPTPLYCSVPVDKVLPTDVEHIVLADLFIPEELNRQTKSSFSLSEDFVDALVSKSFELTGNLETDDCQTKAEETAWVPSGSVKYYDPIKKRPIPISGVQVRCNRWFTTYRAYTNGNGTFKCEDSETFKEPANYSIVFERYDFEIRDAWLSTAKYNAPDKIEGSWNVNFQGDTLNTYYSTVFQAAYKYYYGYNHGLSRPPMNDTWKTQLKIKATKKDNDALGYHCPELRFLGLGSAIHIYTLEESIDLTYATVIHELAHAAHWGLYQSDYNNGSDFVLESWSTGVEVSLTQDMYPNYTTPYYSISYTGIIPDMMDGVGKTKKCFKYYDSQKDEFVSYATPKSYIDNVSGYTLLEIEKSLDGVRDANAWKNKLKTLYDNETEDNLDDAFAFWSTL